MTGGARIWVAWIGGGASEGGTTAVAMTDAVPKAAVVATVPPSVGTGRPVGGTARVRPPGDLAGVPPGSAYRTPSSTTT